MMMASRQALPSPAPADANDIDRFINFDQVAIPSPTFSPISNRSKSFSAPTSILNNNSLPIQPSSQPLFAPPSHQYEAYSNNNGLPAGSLFETYSVNQANQMSYNRPQSYYANPLSDGFEMNTGDDFSFNSSTGYNTYNTLGMDIDFGTTPQSLLTQPVEGLDADYFDTTAIEGQETTPQPPKRAYPGMHQQQAALAKAQAEEKRKEMEAQKQKAAAGSSSRPSGLRPAGSTNKPPADPVVEEKISQLLNQMRHNSVGSSNDDDASTPTASGSNSHGGRFKKDEDDMDEDERLLASEEGKKLSSKERRQLRNKVSARAFRSRRKEYIGQLEGELAAKTAEADDLQAKNEALMNENAQLHELTRSLLSSPAFSEFLKEAGGQAILPASGAPAVKSEPVPQPTQKDVNPNSMAAQNSQSQQFDTPYVGMTMIPEPPAGLNVYESNADSWANMDYSLYDQQVFAVTSLPEGPAIDQVRPTVASGKESLPFMPLPSMESSKTEAPIIERMPSPAEPLESASLPVSLDVGADFDESDPAFALFSDAPAPTASLAVSALEPIFGSIQLEKAFGRIELILQDEVTDDSSTVIERFQCFCSSLDALSERISSVIPN